MHSEFDTYGDYLITLGVLILVLMEDALGVLTIK